MMLIVLLYHVKISLVKKSCILNFCDSKYDILKYSLYSINMFKYFINLHIICKLIKYLTMFVEYFEIFCKI